MCRWLPSQFSSALLNARLRSRRPCISRFIIFLPIEAFLVTCRFSERERPFCWQRNNVSLVELQCYSFCKRLFPPWEYFLPTLGNYYSHLGNISYVIGRFLFLPHLTGDCIATLLPLGGRTVPPLCSVHSP